MSNLSDYIDKVKKWKSKHSEMNEELLIRYVYLNLARRLSFNQNFRPFGSSKNRQIIYKKSSGEKELNECLETNIVICKSGAKLLEYILSNLDVNIKSVEDKNDIRKTPHMYNIIYPKDGSEPYSVDLQEDMY